jgi:hypothetical protein
LSVISQTVDKLYIISRDGKDKRVDGSKENRSEKGDDETASEEGVAPSSAREICFASSEIRCYARVSDHA